MIISTSGLGDRGNDKFEVYQDPVETLDQQNDSSKQKLNIVWIA